MRGESGTATHASRRIWAHNGAEFARDGAARQEPLIIEALGALEPALNGRFSRHSSPDAVAAFMQTN
jgi:hypothetical protein